ncbi:MAG TPA: ankyrin repeat domain-containing protein [Blastocatellia bacterium]
MKARNLFILLVISLAPIGALAQSANDDLIAAAKRGDSAAVKALLAKGADVNAKTRYNQTPLMFAAEKGHLDNAILSFPLFPRVPRFNPNFDQETPVNETIRNQIFVFVTHLFDVIARGADFKRRRRQFIQLAAVARARLSGDLERQKPAG